MKYTFLLLGLVVSCGNPSTEPPLELALQLPMALRKDTPRYERFLKRASHLTLKVETKAGSKGEQTFPVEAWEHLFLGGIEFPQAPDDQMKVSVSLWDRNEQGQLRKDPALRGKGTAKAGEATLRIKLHLELSPKEYD